MRHIKNFVAYAVTAAIFFLGGTGFAHAKSSVSPTHEIQEMQSPPPETPELSIPVPAEHTENTSPAENDILSIVSDVAIYPYGDAENPDAWDEIQLICDTPDAIIRYTTDSSEPTESSTPYDPETPLFVGNIPEAYDPAGFTLSACAFLDGAKSETVAFQIFGQVVCRAVTFTPGEGFYPVDTRVELWCDTPDAEIYKLNGSDPAALYEQPIVLANADTTITAYATCTGYRQSAERVVFYQMGDADMYEPNDTFDDATQLALPAGIEATISNSRDQDYFSFTMPASRRIRIALHQPEGAGISYDLRMFDAEYNRIDVAPSDGDREIVRYLPPGKYYALVSSGEWLYSQESYGLSIDILPMDVYDFSEYNLVNAAYHPDSRFRFDSRNILDAAAVYTSAACLSRWDGFLTEQQDPYLLYYDEYDIADRNEAAYHTATPLFRLRDMVMLPPRADALDNSIADSKCECFSCMQSDEILGVFP